LSIADDLRGFLRSHDLAEVSREQVPALLGELEVIRLRLLLLAIDCGRARQEPSADADRLLTVSEAATSLAVTRGHLYDLIRRGLFPSVRIGKFLRVVSTDLQRWIAEHHAYAVDVATPSSLGSPSSPWRKSLR